MSPDDMGCFAVAWVVITLLQAASASESRRRVDSLERQLDMLRERFNTERNLTMARDADLSRRIHATGHDKEGR